MLKKLNSAYLTILFVMISYSIMAYSSKPTDSISKTPKSHYQYLTEAFLTGQLSISELPPKALLKLANPYDAFQNNRIKLKDGSFIHDKLHDISLYKGKFYVYFGPLPVIFFYIPFKLITGLYPSTNLAILFFNAMGFIFLYLLLIDIQQKFFPKVSKEQLIIVGLVLGFVNNAPYLFYRAAVYEAAVASGFCFLSMALFYLYKILIYPPKINNILLFSLSLSLSVAGRPHFVLVCLLLFPAVLIYLYKKSVKQNITPYLALILPALWIGTLLALYNYLRFDSIFDFGMHYQLLGTGSGGDNVVFKLNEWGINLWYGLYNYLLRPPSIYQYLVFTPKIFSNDILIINGHYYEYTVGMLIAMPFCLLLTLLPKMFGYHYRNTVSLRPLLIFLLAVSSVFLIIFTYLASLSIGTQRYLSDFESCVIVLAIVSLWLMQNYFTPQQFTICNLFFIITSIFSIYINLCLWLFPRSESASILDINFYILNFSLDLNTIIVSCLNLIFVTLLWRRIRSNFRKTKAYNSH